MNSGTGSRVRIAPCYECPNPMTCARRAYTKCAAALYEVAIGPDAEIPGGASGGAGPSRLRVFTRVTLKLIVVRTAGLLLDAAEYMLKLNQWLIRVLG